jgi:general secretion pathway protein M
MTTLPARLARRLLALAILLAPVGILSAAVGQPLLALFAPDQERARALSLVAAYERKAAERPLLEARLHALEARDAGLSGLLDGATTAVAAANLQSQIKAVVERHRGEIKSAQDLPSLTHEDFEKIEVRCDLTAPMSALGPLLYEIETRQPYLFVDALDISAPETWTADAPGAADPKLGIRVTVGGFRRASAP